MFFAEGIPLSPLYLVIPWNKGLLTDPGMNNTGYSPTNKTIGK
jgi:hypothetical protein